jgi:CBS domain-containing protein
MNVSQIMSRNVETCRPEDTLSQAAGKMWDRDVGALPVVGSDGQLCAMITDRDVCMAAYTQGKALHEIPVSVAMSRQIASCRAGDSLIQAEEIMRSRQVRRLPVLDASGNLVGLVSLNDLARESEREVGRKGRQLSGEEVAVTLAAVCGPHRNGALTTVA